MVPLERAVDWSSRGKDRGLLGQGDTPKEPSYRFREQAWMNDYIIIAIIGLVALLLGLGSHGRMRDVEIAREAERWGEAGSTDPYTTWHHSHGGWNRRVR